MENIEIMLQQFITNQQEMNLILSQIATTLNKTTFFDSQLFGAMIGASSALLVFILNEINKTRKEEKIKLMEYCHWLNEQFNFDTPKSLLERARSTGYPEYKPLGEIMVIDLQRHNKYNKKTQGKLRRLFADYENALLKLNQYDEKEEIPKKTMEELEKSYKMIQEYAFKITGDSQWTIR